MRLALELLVEKYQKNVFIAAYNICKNTADANDIVQDVFLQYYILAHKQFTDEENIRAWLLRVAINKAKDCTRSYWRRNKISLDEFETDIPFEAPEEMLLFQNVMRLPEKYRVVIHLFYYEEYSVREISKILKISESGVKMRLSRGRSFLKNYLTGEVNHE